MGESKRINRKVNCRKSGSQGLNTETFGDIEQFLELEMGLTVVYRDRNFVFNSHTAPTYKLILNVKTNIKA